MSKGRIPGYPVRHGKTWTLKEMWALCELYPTNLTWYSIANRMKRTVGACQCRMHLIRVACALSSDVSAKKIFKQMVKQQQVRHKLN